MSDKGKNSGIFYHNWLNEIEDLTDEEAGVLFRAVMTYSAAGEVIDMDRVVKAHFQHMKTRIDQDNEEYERVIKARSEAGAKGGRPKKQTVSDEKQPKAKKANGFFEKQNNPDTDTVTDTVLDDERDIQKVDEGTDDFFKKAGQRFMDLFCQSEGGAFDTVMWEEYCKLAREYDKRVLYNAVSRMRRRDIAEPVKYLRSVCDGILREPKGG